VHHAERHRVTSIGSVDRCSRNTGINLVQHLGGCHDRGSYSRTIDGVLVLLIAVAIALLVPLVTRGSYKRLLGVEWHLGWLLFAGLAIQIFLELYTLPKDRWHDVGFGLLVASYVLILGFCARNFVLRGMGVVMIGIACNALVIVVNQGMPVDLPAKYQNETWAEPTVKHHLQQPDEQLLFLSDIIVLEEPFNTVLSFGDLILAVGLIDLAYNASRRQKSRRVVHIDLSQPEPAPITHQAAAPV
jgi:hypothetical protein